MSWRAVDKELLPPRTPHYKKAFIDPVCLGLGGSNRSAIIKKFGNLLKLDIRNTGYLKVYFLVLLDGSIHVTRLGVQDVKLSAYQYTTLANEVNAFDICLPGKHNGNKVNCEGIIYFTVKSGKIVDYTLKRITTEI